MCALYGARYNLDGVAYESVVIGLQSIITGKRCVPRAPFGRGGEQDSVFLSFSRDGFHFQRSPVRHEVRLAKWPLLYATPRRRVKRSTFT